MGGAHRWTFPIRKTLGPDEIGVTTREGPGEMQGVVTPLRAIPHSFPHRRVIPAPWAAGSGRKDLLNNLLRLQNRPLMAFRLNRTIHARINTCRLQFTN